MRIACLIILLAATPVAAPLLSGCHEPAGPRSVRSDLLTVKIPAIKEAAQRHDTSAVAPLIEDLDSDDPAVRMYAIMALHEITGQDFGYVYYQDLEQRKPAAAKWRQWLEERRAAAGAKTNK